MRQEFKDRWVEKLTNGRFKRQRYDLSDGGSSRCVMAVARETAVELHMLPDCDMQGRDLLTDEELQAIGMSKDAQYYLSTLNDIGISMDGRFPMKLINAVKDFPVRQEVPYMTGEVQTYKNPLLIEIEKEVAIRLIENNRVFKELRGEKDE